MITLTVTKINGQTQGTLSRGFQGSEIYNLRPTTEGNLATAAIFEVEIDGNAVTYTVSETYSAVLLAVTQYMAEAGAELLANKDASNGYAGLTLMKINFYNVARTFLSFFTNTNTAARTYTFQDRNGTIADDTDLALKEAVANKATTFATKNNTLYPSISAVENRVKQTPFGTSASAADTYVVTLTPDVTLAAGLHILLKCTNANTGAATLEIDATGAVAIKRRDGSTALSAADLPAGKYVPMFYDGTNWVCENVG